MASKGTRYTEEQIVGTHKEVEAGTSVADVWPKYELAEQTIYRRHSKYGGLAPASCIACASWNKKTAD